MTRLPQPMLVLQALAALSERLAASAGVMGFARFSMQLFKYCLYHSAQVGHHKNTLRGLHEGRAAEGDDAPGISCGGYALWSACSSVNL